MVENKDDTLYGEACETFANLLAENSNLFFNNKILIKDLKELLLNDTKMEKYKTCKSLTLYINYSINMLISLKKLKAELQLIMNSPANCLSVEELSK